MADQKKWFKVWSTILIDPHHSNLSLEDVGRWTRLGAMMVCSGESGVLKIIPPARAILTALDCPDLDSLFVALKRLPNVQIERLNEEGKSDNGTFTVIMQNWFKYQVDSTSYERLKRSRHKRRGEERRVEESRKEVPPVSPKPSAPRFQRPTAQEVTAYAKSIGYDLDGQRFLDRNDVAGWVWGKARHPIKDWRAAVRTWKENEKRFAKENPYAPHGGTSIFEQAAERKRAAKTSDLRAVPSAREILAGIRGLPTVQSEAEGNPRNGDRKDGTTLGSVRQVSDGDSPEVRGGASGSRTTDEAGGNPSVGELVDDSLRRE